MTTKVPSIPSPTTNNLVQVSQAVKSLLDVREGLVGDKLDANVTFRDLIETGTVSLRPGWNGSTGTPVVPAFPITPGGYNPSTDPTTPTQPTGVVATGLFAVVQLEWDTPSYQNHAYAEIWRAETNVIGNAILIGTSDTSFYTDNLGVTETRYYWVRFVSQANITGPYQGVDGIAASSSSDPTYLMEILTDAYGATGDAPFFSVSAPTVINGVSIPAGTYIKQAYIADATISRAKIADAAIDNAKIANLDAAKINTGFLNADRIQAGTLDAKIANIDAAVITSGTINAARIGSLNAGSITSGFLDSARISAGSISADKITATTLSSISANLGAVTAGSLNINNRFLVDATGNTTIRSATSGARMEIANNVIKVFDASGTLRVKIGDLSA